MRIKFFRDIFNVLIYRITIFFLKLRLFLQKRLKLTKNYQPNPFDIIESITLRDCSDRFDAISNNLPHTPLSCLDIGCNEGYFTFKFAERGGFCVGLDAGRNEIMIADAIKQLNSVNNIVFSNSDVTLESLKGLPKFSLVIFLSVFHHIVRHNGLEYAKQYMNEISNINSKYLVFETGQPDEVTMSWAEEMSFMLPNIQVWVEEMLKDIGYDNIKVIGQHQAVKSTVPRLLFLAEKVEKYAR